MKYVRPLYSVIIVTPNGNRYVIKKRNDDRTDKSNIVEALTLTESDGQLAQKATLTLGNFEIKGFGYPSNLFKVKSRIYIYASGAGKSTDKGEEVFRGFIWATDYSHTTSGIKLKLVCYDNLIYLINSEVCEYFSKGKSTKSIVQTLCQKWGIKVNYTYSTITHPKLPLKGTLADILVSDLAEKVKEKTGKEYVIRSEKDVLQVNPTASNQTRYKIGRGDEGMILSIRKSVTMDGMVTKVVITGKTADSGKTKIEATVSKNTKDYGTLQKLISKNEDTKLSESKKEANNILKEKATPEVEYDISCMDIPWVRKGDRVSIEITKGKFAGMIVKQVTHNCDDATMDLTVREAK